jgi:hypothetical protein
MIVFFIGLWLGAALGAFLVGMLCAAKQSDLVGRISYGAGDAAASTSRLIVTP